jgi:ubiquinone/menaquinone biosynthesis C-methylase UbiE
MNSGTQVSEPVYDRIGVNYSRGRRAEPLWQAALDECLGAAAMIVNVGAGTGSYEPTDRYVLAIEPSAAMIAQRPRGTAPSLQAQAENLPIADQQFDVAMALVTLCLVPGSVEALNSRGAGCSDEVVTAVLVLELGRRDESEFAV